MGNRKILVFGVIVCSLGIRLCLSSRVGMANSTIVKLFEFISSGTNPRGDDQVKSTGEDAWDLRFGDFGLTGDTFVPVVINVSDNPSPTETFTWNNNMEQTSSKGRLVRVSEKRDGSSERSYSIIPGWFSIHPVNWMPKIKNVYPSDVGSDVQKYSDDTVWTKLEPVTRTESQSKIQSTVEPEKSLVQNKRNITNSFSLFTIVKFDNVDCTGEDGTRGICLHQTECERKGGRFTAACASEHGVCCYSEKSCGQHSNDNNTYFVNEGFPDGSTTAPKVCTLTIDKMNVDVQQLRLEFLDFQLRGPSNGTCLDDRLVITGHDSNNIIPAICGSNAGQHIYVDVQDSDGPYNLNVITMGEYFQRNFRIKITQLKQGDEFLSPKHCLQYHTEPQGVLQTFNYRRDSLDVLNDIDVGYFNNLNYAICIKKVKGYCSISYNNLEIDSSQPTFQMINIGEEGVRLLPPLQAGAETFDCPDDYISVSGMRLCGEKLNDATIEVNLTRNFPVTDVSNGPFMLLVKTDASETGRGFYLTYTQNSCDV